MLNTNNVIWVQATRIHEVSNTGLVRNISSGKILKPWISTTGYYMIKIYVDGKRKNLRVHRLVCAAFTPNPHNKPDVNHIDSNKLNNNSENLEWCTHAENLAHASINGLISTAPTTTGKKLSDVSKYYNVGWDKSRNKWIASITHNKKTLMSKRFNTEEEAALHVNHIIDTYGLSDRPKNIIC